MADPRAVISAMVLGMIHRIGGHDAAAALIGARWGRSISKGTLTKKAAGELDWTLADVMALEDGLGDYPISRFMADRGRDAGGCDVNRAVAGLAKEAGEAMAAALSAGAPAEMLKEAREAQAAAQALVSALEARVRN